VILCLIEQRCQASACLLRMPIQHLCLCQRCLRPMEGKQVITHVPLGYRRFKQPPGLFSPPFRLTQQPQGVEEEHIHG